MNTNILKAEVREFLQANENKSPAELALQKSPFEDVSAAELAQQLDGLQRSHRKLPRWYNTPGIYFPPKVSMEQASSEATAHFKAKLIEPGSKLIDVTGGFGVDSYYFSTIASQVVYCEQQPALVEIATHNAQVLGANNMTSIHGDGVSYMLSLPDDAFDYIYIDPSRRISQRKVFLLSDCEPDVVALRHDMLKKAATVIIKTAPLLDISAAIHELGHVCEVHIISVANECKELIFLLKRNFSGSPKITATALNPHSLSKSFSFTNEDEQEAVAAFAHPQHYLYEPDAALMKSGAFKLISERYGLQKLHTNTHLYTSEKRLRDFSGRTFRIDKVVSYAEFKKDKQPKQGNVTTRNFPLKPDELRRKHRIRENNRLYLFFCTDMDDKLLVIFACKDAEML